VKRQARHGGSVTDYCGNCIYENGNLDKILIEGGYITMDGTIPIYHYYVRDHEGNNRIVIKMKNAAEQVNHYYPFGSLFAESTGGDIQQYKYNGKELDREYGLNLYDYGARYYDAVLGSWTTTDPMAEKHHEWSVYNYCIDNPIRFIDPNGNEKFEVLNKKNPLNKNLYLDFKYFQDSPNDINIWAHGYQFGILNGKDGDKIIDTNQFSKFLAKNSKLWREHIKTGKRVRIVLHSCETGKENKINKSYARILSRNLKNVSIIAPNKKLNVFTSLDLSTSVAIEYNGKIYFVGLGKYVETEVGDENGVSLSPGKWIEYKNGKIIKTYSYISKPGSIQDN
jgi:RHS repeat-associated protein